MCSYSCTLFCKSKSLAELTARCMSFSYSLTHDYNQTLLLMPQAPTPENSRLLQQYPTGHPFRRRSQLTVRAPSRSPFIRSILQVLIQIHSCYFVVLNLDIFPLFRSSKLSQHQRFALICHTLDSSME